MSSRTITLVGITKVDFTCQGETFIHIHLGFKGISTCLSTGILSQGHRSIIETCCSSGCEITCLVFIRNNKVCFLLIASLTKWRISVISTSSHSIQLCSNCCNTVNYWITSKTCICNLSHQPLNGVTKTFTLFCISSICCWCSKQCCWFSDFFLNCCDSCLDFSFSSCVCQFCLIVFSNINKQFCFWNVLIQDCFFIFLSRCFWCSRYCWTCWFWMWSWTTCTFSMWLTIRSWVLLAKWYRFRDSLWQFCWYRLWQWCWSICACLSINWRACRLLTSWWCYWSFWCWSCTQDNRLRIGCYIMISS